MSTANRHVTTVSSPNADTIAAAFGGRKSGGGWMARCPVHEDRNPSLSIREADGGQVLVHCFAGCAQDAILDALRQRGLWPRQPLPSPNQASRPSTSEASKTPPNRPADRSARELWAHSPAASGDHPYLASKRIGAHGARAASGRLILPLFDATSTLHGLQFIADNGEKRFFPGSKVTGHCFLIGEAEPAVPCYIAEGFATAATIYEVMGGQAAVAFNAGNLKSAAQALRQQWPERPLVLCADDDAGTTGNPGLTAAREAARAVNGRVAIPGFGADRPEGATDFNDLALSQGPQAVRDSIQQAASAFPALDNLVEMTMSNPGYPFRPEITEELKILRTDDLARFEALRADLKARTQCRVTQLDRTLKEPESGGVSDAGGDSRLADRLATLAGEALHNWDDVFLACEDRLAFADLNLDGRRETWPVDSDYFKHWLTIQCFDLSGDTPGSEALKAAVNLIWAKARFAGRERPVFIRSGAAEGKLYLDLCDESWRCVEIAREGWRVIESIESPIRFRRDTAMTALPVPVRGGGIAELRPFVNSASEDEFVLLVAWLLAALRGHGPYPVLVLSGEPGAAKSTTVKILRALVDPSHIPTRVFPATDADLFLVAHHNHLLAFDNLSGLSHAASDLLCQLATGGGFGTRQLYTNQEEFLLHASRPVMLNGIANVAVRTDLADRAVGLTLESIAETDRRLETELWDQFERVRPRILGALLDALVVGLNRRPEIRLPTIPRMADFAQWAAACETAYWPEGTFQAAYSENRQEAMADVIENDPVADSIRQLVSSQPWEGMASELLLALESIAGERAVKSKRWPGSASILARNLKRVAPALRRFGIEIVSLRKGHRGLRVIQIKNVAV